MSTNASDRSTRRKPSKVRHEALEVGRRLLIPGGPGAITLKAVGAAMSMSHANLIHHFGSADAFQLELRTFMVDELTRAVTSVVERGDQSDDRALVDMVFDAYGSGGIGMLLAWSAVNRSKDRMEGPLEAVGDLVAALESHIEGPTRSQRARAMTCLVTSLAFADSMIGKGLSEIGGGNPRFMRDITLAIINHLRADPKHGR